MQPTADQIRLFRRFFTGLTNVFGTYDPATGRAWQVKRPVTDEVIVAHLQGRQPYGVYLLVEDCTRAVVADFDVDDLDPPMQFITRALNYDLAAYIERSKSKGYHVWMFLDDDGVPAAKARLVVRHILEEIGQPCTEVFPKHDRLDTRTAYGNYIYAPLFGASVPQGRTVFLDPKRGLNPFADQWRFLEESTRVLEQQLDEVIEVNELGRQPPARAPARSRPIGGTDGAGGLPPCARRMLAEGVSAYQRVACFRLAVQLRKVGLPADTAIAALQVWANKNRPVAEKRVIAADEIIAQTRSAYENGYRGCGCEEPAVRPYCDPACPIRMRRSKPAVAESGAARTNDQSRALPAAPRSDAPVHETTSTPLSERRTTMAERTSQRPVKEFRAGSVQAAIWQHDAEQHGQRFVRHSVRVSKSFFDRQENKWQDSEYFFVNDLPRVRLLVEKAFEFIACKESDPDSARVSNGATADASVEA